MAKIIDFPTKQKKNVEKYKQYLSKCNKDQVLEEMSKFIEMRSISGPIPTIEMIELGIPLFERVVQLVTTPELKYFCVGYLHFLNEEKKKLEGNPPPTAG